MHTRLRNLLLVSAIWIGSTYAVVEPQVLAGVNITQTCLDVKSSISSPTCNATQPCISLVTDVIPRCIQLGDDPGCWCGNHDPLHYCALCMSTPTDNTTNPDQTELAISSHQNFHIFCAAYVNNTGSGNSNSNSNGGGSSSNTGAIVGGVVGGVALVCVIGLGVFFYSQRRRNQGKGLRPPESPYIQQPQQMTGTSTVVDTVGNRNSIFSSFTNGGGKKADEFAPAHPERGTGFTPVPYMLHPGSPATGGPNSPLTSTPPLNTASSVSGPGFASQQGATQAELGYDTSMLRDLDNPTYGNRNSVTYNR